MKKLLLITGIAILFVVEILRVYLISPFAGSEQTGSVRFAYFIYNNIWYIRIAALFFIIAGLLGTFSQWKKWQKVLSILVVLFYGIIFYMANYEFVSAKVFSPIRDIKFSFFTSNQVNADKLVAGVTINGESKAYPIEIIGYHHQLQDTVGGEPIIVTYCTACHTARVYSSIVNGVKENFRLVGMSRLNSIFEDNSTKSWWQQATGTAIAGPLKGQLLKEIPCGQMSLSAWRRKHSNSLILQPDAAFQTKYAELGGFSRGAVKGTLEKHDWQSWQAKSWVLGVQYNGESKAYDWNELIIKQVINDSLKMFPVVLIVEPDKTSYHVWSRQVNGKTLQFMIDNNTLKDSTKSIWSFDGFCISGPMAGEQLKPVNASQEFWHSWKTFHPATLKYIQRY